MSIEVLILLGAVVFFALIVHLTKLFGTEMDTPYWQRLKNEHDKNAEGGAVYTPSSVGGADRPD